MTILYKGSLSPSDMALWDGKTGTFTRNTATGGSETLNKVSWVGVDALEVFGARVNRTVDTLNLALERIGTSTQVPLWIAPGTWTIDDDITIPDNISVILPMGTILSISAGKTITFNNVISAGAYQIFSGDGTVVFGNDANFEAIAEWWGIDGTADEVEINAALNAARICVLAGSTYSIADEITIPAGGSLVGMENAGNMIKDNCEITPTSDVSIAINNTDSTGGTIKNIQLDMDNMVTGSMGIKMAGTWHSKLENIYIKNLNDTGGTPNTTIGILVTYDDVDSSRGGYWNTFENVIVIGNNDQGVGIKCVGQTPNPNFNQLTMISVRTKSCYDGFVFDYSGGGILALNCRSEEHANDGVVVTNQKVTAGYPQWIGGEISTNVGYAFNGPIVARNCVTANNTAGVVANGAIQERYDDTYDNKYIYLNGGGFRPQVQGVGVDPDAVALIASDVVPSDYGTCRLTGDVGGTLLTSTPTIEQGWDGQELEIIGGSDTAYLTLQDDNTLSGSLLRLKTNTVTLQLEDVLRLRYSSKFSAWVEIGRSMGNATIADPSGGATTDAEARTAIESILDALIVAGIIRET